MATGSQIERVITLIVQEVLGNTPANDVEQRTLAFTQMLCGALAGLDHPDAAAAIRIMLGVRQPAAGA